MTDQTHNALSDNASGGVFVTAEVGDGAVQIATALNSLLADVFTLYFKTKNFHWHVSGSHFRDYHRLFDEHADELIATTDAVAERVRKVGGNTLKSLQQVVRLARLPGNEADFVLPAQMLTELRNDNERLAGSMRDAHFVCGGFDDLASMSLLENCIDEAERRVWFLFECTREA